MRRRATLGEPLIARSGNLSTEDEQQQQGAESAKAVNGDEDGEQRRQSTRPLGGVAAADRRAGLEATRARLRSPRPPAPVAGAGAVLDGRGGRRPRAPT